MKTIAVRECHAFGTPPVGLSLGIDVPRMAISAEVESSSFVGQTDAVQVWTLYEHCMFANGPEFLVQPFPSYSRWTRRLLRHPEQHAFRCRTFHRDLNGGLGYLRTGPIKTSSSG
jgi:hypothetical protein